MKLAGKTDVGRVRQENQDDYRAGELPGGAVWALVCDGMGGAKGGREASQGACNVIEQVFQEQYAQCGAGQEGAFLKKALISANRYVFNKAAHEESLAGMGTTAVCALVRGGEATLCHAGDSRAYLCRGGKLTQLTHDHSYVQELVDCGTITEEEAEHHPQKNIITRALGVDYRLEPEVTSVQLQAKDLLLLCSDGLTNMVPVEQMEQLLAQGPFYDLPDRLVDAAYAAANFPLPVITVDLGTATTFNVVDKDRVFRGGVICPGLSTGLRALGERCAQLPQVHLGSPKKAIGTNTESCMLSGSVLGTAVLIDGMVQRIEEELGSPATLVVTGGLAKYVTPLCRHPLAYDPELLMKGLALLYQLNSPQEHSRSHGGGRHYGQQGRLRAKHPHPNRRTRREPEALVG